MTARTAIVQSRIDPQIRDEASAVLARMGLTVSDAIRIVLTRTAQEGAFPAELVVDPARYDEWFRARVLAALETEAPVLEHETVSEWFKLKRARLGQTP